MLSFNTLLEGVDLDPTEVVIFRHRPPQPMLARQLPVYRMEDLASFDAYQSFQGPRSAAVLKKAKMLASFIGLEPGEATFAGLWRIGSSRVMTPDDIAPGTPMGRFLEMGAERNSGDLVFDLQAMAQYDDWVGKLVVEWPTTGINWKLRADRHTVPVKAVERENAFLKPKLGWEDEVFSWRDLQILSPTWRAAMSQWRGVYYVYDQGLRSGYVGSACGADNIMQRWLDYARTGHGGNVGLKNSNPEHLSFSVLQTVALECPEVEVLKLEQNWMTRLGTRKHGLNS